MPRPVDLAGIKARAEQELTPLSTRYIGVAGSPADYIFVRWVAQMTAVELHTVWERFVEARLVAALNASPAAFLKTHSVRGVTRIPKGLALYIVRGGRRFLEVRSTRDLRSKAEDLVGKAANPFSALTKTDLQYLDCLAAIRNFVVHGSDAGAAAYRANLKKCYGITAAPGPGEFLGAKDFRTSSPLRYKSRVEGLIAVVKDAIKRT